jgi:hypothetical protein
VNGGASSNGTSSNGASSNGASSNGASSNTGMGNGGQAAYGQVYEGGEFHLGPVDYEETEWHNACAPGTGYVAEVREAQGDLLAGLWNGIPDVAGYCDACISVTTAEGKSATLRVVTYGDTTMNSIDVEAKSTKRPRSGSRMPRGYIRPILDEAAARQHKGLRPLHPARGVGPSTPTGGSPLDPRSRCSLW